MNSRWAGFLITYRRPEALEEMIHHLLSQTRPPEHLLVIDNDPARSAEPVVGGFPSRTVEYRSRPDNPGPAGAAALALEVLVRKGFDWIYWGDDDDPPSASGQIERLLGLAREDMRVGAVAAAGVRWNWSTGRPVRIPDEELVGVVEADAVAGCDQLLVSRKAVEATGLPNAELFWGLEDYGYCLRLRRAGFRILLDGDFMAERRKAAGRAGYVPRSSPVPRWNLRTLPRYYYSTRNHVYLMRRIFGRPDLARREVGRTLIRIVTSWRRGPRYGAVFSRTQLRALWDGFRGHMGRTLDLAGTKPEEENR